jgi:hypothetical protein
MMGEGVNYISYQGPVLLEGWPWLQRFLISFWRFLDNEMSSKN